jgi:transposase InsO family protein
VRKLREADRLLGEGRDVAAVAKELEVSEQTLHRWRAQYGGLKATDAKLTANALRDWCRFSGSGTSYIEPGSRWENPFVESFASRVRDEVLAVEAFDSLPEAKIVIEDWRNTYNTRRPPSSLGWKTPAAFAADWRT